MFPDVANLVLAIVANVLSACVTLSPLPRVVYLVRVGKIEAHDGMPYEFMWFSNAWWISYGVSVSLLTVTCISAFGFITALLYLFVWQSYLGVKDKRRLTHMIMLPVLLTAVAVVDIVLLFGVTSTDVRSDILGWIGSVVSVAFSFSPLVSVAQTGKVRSITPLLSLAIVLNCTVWTLYGIGIENLFLAISNGIEIAAGLMQLGLYYFWPTAPTSTVESPAVPVAPKVLVQRRRRRHHGARYAPVGSRPPSA